MNFMQGTYFQNFAASRRHTQAQMVMQPGAISVEASLGVEDGTTFDHLNHFPQ